MHKWYHLIVVQKKNNNNNNNKNNIKLEDKVEVRVYLRPDQATG